MHPKTVNWGLHTNVPLVKHWKLSTPKLKAGLLYPLPCIQNGHALLYPQSGIALLCPDIGVALLYPHNRDTLLYIQMMY